MNPPIPVLSQIRSRLDRQSQSAALDAQVLLAHITGRTRAWVLAHPELALTGEEEINLEAALARLEQGEPLPYILGHWEFYGLDFWVTPATLIPRPETELLVESAMEWLGLHPGRRLAADVGTGTGCIAVALAAHFPDLHLLACDISLQALKVAQKNVLRHCLRSQISCLQADLLPPARQPFNLICANLPYIPSEALKSLAVASWEPCQALDGGPDGLDPVRRLLKSAPAALAPGCRMLLEIEATQGAAALELARSAFPRAEVVLVQDLAGRDRLICIQT